MDNSRFSCTCFFLLNSQIFSAFAGFLPKGIRQVGRHVTPIRHEYESMAAVFGENETLFPENTTQAIELLRFVTAYRVGLEAVIDVTPYSPVFQSLAKSKGELNFYAFIDTWVDNDTGSKVLYMNNVSGQCSAINVSDGNGWSLSAELYFWPKADSDVDTKPKASVTVGTGYFGSNYKIGAMTIHEATTLEHNGHVSATLDEKDTFKDTRKAYVYHCPGGAAQIHRAAFVGYIAFQAASLMTLPNNTRDEAMDALEDEYTEYVAEASFSRLDVHTVDHDSHSIEASFDKSVVTPDIGMGVYYVAGVMTDGQLEPDFWVNTSYPFKPVGEVVAINDGTITIEMKTDCLPVGPDLGMPTLAIPNHNNVLNESRSLVHSAMLVGKAWKNHVGHRPMLLQPHSDGSVADAVNMNKGAHITPLETPILLGELDLDSATVSAGLSALQLDVSSGAVNFSKVCVVKQQQHGHVFQRDFEVPGNFKEGDAMVMQLVVTGHGWADTTEQCGEYCHAVYRVWIDDASVANVTQFRDDCSSNPIDAQFGTWDESRNGWCPGSVEPGLFIDVTKFVKAGHASHRMKFDVVVWSNHTRQYTPYIDYGGFALRDEASLIVGMTLFAYDETAVHAVRAQPKALTPAEAAIRDGCNAPAMLHPPENVAPYDYQVLLQTALSTHTRGVQKTALRETRRWSRPLPSQLEFNAHKFLGRKHAQQMALAHGIGAFKATLLRDRPAPPEGSEVPWALKQVAATSGAPGSWHDRFDVLDHAPWYLYNATAHGTPGKEAGAQEVTVFSETLVQSATRTVKTTLKGTDLPETWSQAVLRLKLQKPTDLEIDHWDRVGSFGITLSGPDTELMRLRPGPSRDAGEKRHWRVNLRNSSVRDSALAAATEFGQQ